jgi:hypothetical protein
MLSARALGVLYYLVVTSESPTVAHLQTVFKEGREAIRRAVKDLEELGFIERQNTKINDRFITESLVTEAGVKYLIDAGFWTRATRVSGHLYKHTQQNNYILLTAINSKEYTDEVRDSSNASPEKETYVGYEWFDKTSSEDDELLDKQRQKVKYNAEQAREAKEGKITKKMVHRTMISTDAWTPSDIGYEFADRLLDFWNIQPWVIVQTRFIPALANMRARLGTNGEVELEMIDLFFRSVDFQKHDDPHMLWKMFIKRSPELAVLVTRANVSEEVLVMAQEAADKSWDWMEN